MEQPNLTPSPQELVAFLASTDLFKHVAPSILNLLENDVTLVHLEQGQILIRHGELADCFYIVMSGTLQVLLLDPQGQFVFTETIGVGHSVGELAFFTDGKRSATVSALEPCQLISLSHADFKILTAYHPPALIELYQVVGRRLRQIQLRLALYASNLFTGLSREILKDFEAEMWLVTLASGQMLLQAGDVADALYIVVSGRLRAIPLYGATVELGRGQVVGELGLLTEENRVASVYAIRDTLLAKLSREGFNRLIQKHPQAIIKQFIATSVRSLVQQLNDKLPQVSNIITLAIVPLALDVPLTQFTEYLVEALSQFGATLHLNSTRFNALVGHDSAAQTPESNPYNFSIIRWLSEQELNYRYVVYETDKVASLWTYRCLRQADHVLLVANSTTTPTLGHIELTLAPQQTLASSAKQSLILLHPNGEQLPTGTHKWLDLYPKLDQHFHIRWDTPNDFSRLARFIVGRPIGVVFGGGGSRGFAHIGVIKAMLELGIPIDFVGGTSIGAAIAAQYALNWSCEKMVQHCKGLYDFGMFDVTLPLVSLLAIQEWTRKARLIFGEVSIEDLWLPYFCVSSNLSQIEEKIHRTGLVWQAIRASSGFPGFTPPVNYDGDLLVDGGLLNNLPIELMRKTCKQGTVIAVDVSPPEVLPKSYPYGYKISGWQVLWQKINPYTTRFNVPDVITLIYRAATLASSRQSRNLLEQRLADIYISPPVAHYGIVDYNSIDTLVEIGYLFSKELIPTLYKAESSQ